MSVSRTCNAAKAGMSSDNPQYLSSIISSLNGAKPCSNTKSEPPNTNISPVNGLTDCKSASLKRKASDMMDTMTISSSPSSSLVFNRSSQNPIAKSKIQPDRYALSITKPTSQKPTVPATLPSTAFANGASKPPPKKGSYKEIMARAEAAKAAAATLGQITHKPVVKLSKRERERAAMEMQQKEKILASRSKGLQTGKTTISHVKKNGKVVEQIKERRKPVELDYKGTMRANTSIPRTTNSQSSAGKHLDKDTTKAFTNRSRSLYDNQDTEKRYVYAGSSEEEEDGEEGDAANDDESMEGGGFDALEEEEQLSLAIARKEDARALAEESEHRRQKMERKKKLEQLAAKAPKRRF